MNPAYVLRYEATHSVNDHEVYEQVGFLFAQQVK